MTLLLLPRVIVPIAVLAPPPFHQCRSSYFHALCVIMPIAVLAPPPFQCRSSYSMRYASSCRSLSSHLRHSSVAPPTPCAMRHHANRYPRTSIIPVSLCCHSSDPSPSTIIILLSLAVLNTQVWLPANWNEAVLPKTRILS